MKRWRMLVFGLVAMAQVAAPASLIWKRERTLKHGRVWKFRTAPVDPVDAFRGRYVALNYEIARGEAIKPFSEGLSQSEAAYVVLKEDAEGFAAIERLSVEPVVGDNVIEVKEWWGGSILLPFDKYWVTETDAKAAEAAYRLQNTREKRNAYVTVRVRDGDSGIEELYLDGMPLGEYLRAHSK